MGCLFVLAMVLAFMVIVWAFSVSPILGLLLLGGVGVAIHLSNKREREKKEEEVNHRQHNLWEVQSKLKDYSFSQKHISSNMDSSIMIDEEAKKLCIIQDQLSKERVYDYKDILASEIIEDGVTVNKTSRSSQIGGAILGGIVAGGTGAIIGGLSGESTTEEEVNRIDLKVIVNDTKQPVKFISFLLDESDDPMTNKPFGIKKSDSRYKDAFKEVTHWHSLISVLIRQADQHDKVHKEESSNSVADEIKKLSDLFNEGILTEEEYTQQKMKILK
ncbi:SHOCT domain-containing protein [Alkalihalobacillus sp. R86527]|uniref:SHOCT domain-containing protein n=1 Tax=Alkalihalobacillus sp. R86527 TaxID=3093863 RepID=UPI00366B442C